MTISEVGKKYNLTEDTLRYYERIGLLPPVKRNKRGIRNYTQEDFEWIEFIKCMIKTGISIEVLIEYVSLWQQDDSLAKRDILTELKEELSEKIDELMSFKKQIDEKLAFLNKIY